MGLDNCENLNSLYLCNARSFAIKRHRRYQRYFASLLNQQDQVIKSNRIYWNI